MINDGGDGGHAAPSAHNKPILETRGISKRFGAVQALTNVDFEVYPGEVVALVGDNGAGKSTLVKCIAGTHAPDEGKIIFDGKEIHLHAPSDATRLGIETVYQEKSLGDKQPLWRNFFEDDGLVQFMHRMAGYLLLVFGGFATSGSDSSLTYDLTDEIWRIQVSQNDRPTLMNRHRAWMGSCVGWDEEQTSLVRVLAFGGTANGAGSGGAVISVSTGFQSNEPAPA